MPDDAHAPQEEAFCIDSDERAEWLLRKMGNLHAEKARVAAQAAEIVRQIDADLADLSFLYGAQLESYCRRKLAASGNRRRSVAFLQGTCAFRSVPAGLRVKDIAAALQFAQEALPSVVRTVQSLDSGAYREAAIERLKATGEVLPGVETTPERDNFTVKF
jgi:phage host-nuclease inhibitor protein Gam